MQQMTLPTINEHPEVEITHHFSSGVYAKEIKVPAGLRVDQHKHPFDHLSILASGKAVIDCDGTLTELQGPAAMTIVADVAHKIYAVTDIVWFCIHATNETDADKIDHTLIKE